MKIKYSLIGLLFITIVYADSISDQDFDGVPDNVDQCKNTPFLNEVNAKGCTTHILTLPFEREEKNLVFKLGYGYTTNEDLINREVQRNTKFELNYYQNSWSYSLQGGVYSHQEHSGTLDTILNVRKRIHINPKFVISLGTGLRLPSHDFIGNKTDYILYSSFHYYPTHALSFFGGYNYTFIKDEMTIAPLQNTKTFYIGSGYFFTPKFYLNLNYNYADSKFSFEHDIQSLSTSLYYKINQKWFTTLFYRQEIADEDLHNSWILKLGYNIW